MASLSDIRAFYRLLADLKGRICGLRTLATCDGKMDWPQRGKKKIQAIVAVMRKLLHAIWGMFETNTTFNGVVLFPQLTPDPLTHQ